MRKSNCKHDWFDITVRDEEYGNTYKCSKCGKEKFEPRKKEPTKIFGVVEVMGDVS